MIKILVYSVVVRNHPDISKQVVRFEHAKHFTEVYPSEKTEKIVEQEYPSDLFIVEFLHGRVDREIDIDKIKDKKS